MEYNGEYQFTEPGEELQELFDKVNALPNKEELDAELEGIRTGETMRDGSISWDNLDHNVQNIIETSGGGGSGLSSEWGDSEKLGITQRKLTEEHLEVNARISGVEGNLHDNYYKKDEVYNKRESYSKEEVNAIASAFTSQNYATVTASLDTTASDIPALIATQVPGQKEMTDIVYRVAQFNGEEYDESQYSEYTYNGSEYVLMDVKNTGIDDTPIPNSGNLITSGGVFPIVDDISKKTPLEPSEIVYGERYVPTTQKTSENENNQIWKYPVIGGENYAFSCGYKTTVLSYAITWFSGTEENPTQISYEPYTNDPSGESVTYNDVVVHAPETATFCWMNIRGDKAHLTSLKALDVVKSEYLLNGHNENVLAILQNKAYQVEEVAISPDGILSQTGMYMNGNGNVATLSTFDVKFYPVTEGDAYILSGSIPPNNSGLYMLFWVDATWENSQSASTLNEHLISKEYRADSEVGVSLTKKPVTAPAGAAYACVNVRSDRFYEYSFGAFGEYISLSDVYHELNNKADLSSISEVVDQTPDAVFDNMRFNFKTGEGIEAIGYEYRKYEVDENTKYAFSASLPARITITLIGWLDTDGQVISYEPYKGSLEEAVTFTKVGVVSPVGAKYAILNVRKSNASQYGFYMIGDIIDISGLESRVDHLNPGNMEVTINNIGSIGGSVLVRTHLNDTKDIVTEYSRKDNDEIAPIQTYIGNRSDATATIVSAANKFHEWDDSTAGLFNSSYAPWHMYAQHGYEIPVVTCSDSVDGVEVGSEWTDQLSRNYTVGSVDTTGKKLYILPVVTVDENGLYTRSWINHVVETGDNAISSLTNGGVTLTVTTQSYTQLRPLQEKTNLKVIVDGSEVTGNGVYMCNDLILSETLLGFNPFTVNTWYPSPVKNTIAVELTQSFNIHGLSHRYDVILNVLEPLKIDGYGVNQGQGLVGSDYGEVGSVVDGYDGYVFVPKVKREYDNISSDVPRVPQSSSFSINAHRINTQIYDVNDQPDRVITYLYNPTSHEYLAGFASGLSLVRGASLKSKRNEYILVGSGDANVSLSMNASLRNKGYCKIITTGNTNKFTNNVLYAGFVENFSTYFCYFDPTANDGQVYWYKDGNGYIIYGHWQSAVGHTVINVPSEMDGLQVEVVEVTMNGAAPCVSLLTDNIANGKFYVNVESMGEVNTVWLVVKTK